LVSLFKTEPTSGSRVAGLVTDLTCRAVGRTRKRILMRWSSTTATPLATIEISVAVARIGATIVPRIAGTLTLSSVGSRDVDFKSCFVSLQTQFI
jgi:hypothetical protein